jgi:hypothetical protein
MTKFFINDWSYFTKDESHFTQNWKSFKNLIAVEPRWVEVIVWISCYYLNSMHTSAAVGLPRIRSDHSTENQGLRSAHSLGLQFISAPIRGHKRSAIILRSADPPIQKVNKVQVSQIVRPPGFQCRWRIIFSLHSELNPVAAQSRIWREMGGPAALHPAQVQSFDCLRICAFHGVHVDQMTLFCQFCNRG